MHLVVGVGLLVIAFSSAALWLGQRGATRKKRIRFAERTPLTLKEFWRQFYEERGVPLEVVEELLPVIAEAAEVPVTLLRPTDRFAEELAPEKGWEFGDGLAEVGWWVRALAKRSGKEVDLSEVRTVDDLIRLAHDLAAPT